MRMDESDGPWQVWSDGVTPILSDVDYASMKDKVDTLVANGHTDVYGENNDTGDTYEP
jgi:hypothetical protein